MRGAGLCTGVLSADGITVRVFTAAAARNATGIVDRFDDG